MTPRLISWSRIRMYRDCPLKFRLYEEGKPQGAVPLFDDGLRLHRALDVYVGHCQEAGLTEDYEFADQMAEAAETPRLRRAIRQFPITITIRPDLVPAGLETSFELPVAGWLLRGRIDRVEVEPDGTVRIIDYKSGFRPQYPKEPDQQLLTYAGAWQRLRGGERFRLRQVWPEADPQLPAPEWLVDGSVSLGHVEAVINEIEARTDWEPTPSQDACQSCPFLTTCCPVGHEDVITSPEAAICAYERSQRLLSAVKAYCAEHYVEGLPQWMAPKYVARGENHYTVKGTGREKAANLTEVIRKVFVHAAAGEVKLSSALDVKTGWLSREMGKRTPLAEEIEPYVYQTPPRPRWQP